MSGVTLDTPPEKCASCGGKLNGTYWAGNRCAFCAGFFDTAVPWLPKLSVAAPKSLEQKVAGLNAKFMVDFGETKSIKAGDVVVAGNTLAQAISSAAADGAVVYWPPAAQPDGLALADGATYSNLSSAVGGVAWEKWLAEMGGVKELWDKRPPLPAFQLTTFDKDFLPSVGIQGW